MTNLIKKIIISEIEGKKNARKKLAEIELAKIEGAVSQLNERLNHFGEEIRDLRKEIKSNFKWTLGIFISMWISIILVILFK